MRVLAGTTLRVCGLLLAAAVALTGCRAAAPERAVALSVSLDSASYDIGEPVQATVSVRNVTDAELALAGLDSGTLKFYVRRLGAGGPTQRWPVLPKGILSEPRLLRPGGTTQRAFLFTELTKEPGQWGLFVSLSGLGSEKYRHRFPPAFCGEIAQYQVTETVRFKRDFRAPFAIITRDQAVQLVREHLGLGEDDRLEPRLMPLGQSGLYVWQVLVSPKGEPPEQARACEVNPYSCIVRPVEQKQEPK